LLDFFLEAFLLDFLEVFLAFLLDFFLEAFLAFFFPSSVTSTFLLFLFFLPPVCSASLKIFLNLVSNSDVEVSSSCSPPFCGTSTTDNHCGNDAVVTVSVSKNSDTFPAFFLFLL
jgi:hypothetical protein